MQTSNNKTLWFKSHEMQNDLIWKIRTSKSLTLKRRKCLTVKLQKNKGSYNI